MRFHCLTNALKSHKHQQSVQYFSFKLNYWEIDKHNRIDVIINYISGCC